MPLFGSLSDPATGLSDWAPEYPDPVRASPRWPRSDLAFVSPQGELSWLPTFPDRFGAPRASNAVVFAYVPAVSRWGLDALPWLPTFPDFARARPPSQLWRGLVAYAAEPSVFPAPPSVPPLAWLSSYPDQHLVRLRRPPGWLSLVLDPSFISPLSWAARCPDQVLRPRRLSQLEPEVGVPSWQATLLPLVPVVWWPRDPPDSVEGPTGDGQWWPKPADAPGLITAWRKKKGR